MPRPKPPEKLKNILITEPVNFTKEQGSEIKSILGILHDPRLDRAAKDAVIAGIEETLTFHRFFVEATEPTVAAKIKHLEKLKRDADILLQSLSGFDLTRRAMEPICATIDAELERLRAFNKLGRKTDSALHNTLTLLNLSFAQHCRNPTESKLIEFISAALAYAGIPYPLDTKRLATRGKLSEKS